MKSLDSKTQGFMSLVGILVIIVVATLVVAGFYIYQSPKEALVQTQKPQESSTSKTDALQLKEENSAPQETKPTLPPSLKTTPSLTSPVSVKKLSSCKEINESGEYLLTTDIMNTKTGPCIKFQNVSNISLDCQDYTITSKNEGINIYIKEVSDFKIHNCKLVSSVNLPTERVQHTLRIENSKQGEVYNNVIGGNFATISGSTAVTIRNNTFINEFSVYKSNNITITKNDFSNGGNIAVLLHLQDGHNNSVISNTMDGKSDGIFRGLSDSIGSDDGIVIGNESQDTIQGNTIQNVFDCGIENVGYMFDSKIIGNKVKNAGVCLVGGWWQSSVKGNLIKDNIADNVAQLFVFSRLRGLQPGEQYVYFKDNTFENNKMINPRLEDVFALPASSIYMITSSVPSSSIVVGNNVFRNNDFTTTLGPITFEPANMIVDGGGNICPAPEDASFPLKCN